jgi:2,4-dienoyl-CoA reductase-like NADH-dependent reductase (Old Yellow Enzyme family)
VYIANEAFTAESAQAYVADGIADAVAFGKPYIANPDLAVRIAKGAEWNAQDPDTFYASTAKGYTDYPALG